MDAAARRHGAQGLAATQCGVDAAIVLLGDEAFVNPTIVARSPEARLRCWTERCLALPPDVRVELDVIEELVRQCSILAVAVAGDLKFLQSEVAQPLHQLIP